MDGARAACGRAGRRAGGGHRAPRAGVRDRLDPGRGAEPESHPRAIASRPRCGAGQRAGDDGVPAANLLRHGSTSATDPARRFSNGVVEQADTDRDHAQLMVLGSASDDTLSRLRVGEALSAVLLHATDLGLATCPLSQPLEVPAVRDALRDELLGGRMDPQLILRIGWATRGEALPATPRRLLSEQIDRFGQ